MIKCRLSEILGRKRINIKQLSRMTGLAYPTVWNLYHEKTMRPDLRVVEQICQVLECQVGDLFEYVETKSKT